MSAPSRLETRAIPPRAAWALEQAGVHPLLARLYAARGITSPEVLEDGLEHLLSPADLQGANEAADLLIETLDAGGRIVVVADYDCDGATACAVALRGLKLLGAAPGQVVPLVPDRRLHGYGLTPTLVDLAMAHRPALLLTVDNGIASLEGVAHARALGLKVLITDHHLPAASADGEVLLPDADVIVNPNQPGCGFASRSLAGVGVMFYVLLATRARLRAAGRYANAAQPRLDALLDLVALGTVADVVALDPNNRRLVAQGLKRMRQGRMQPGVAALFGAAGRDPSRASAFDLGFALGPRINAAGRLADMTLGIACLTTDDADEAIDLATRLDQVNRERRQVEAGMREAAEAHLQRCLQDAAEGAPTPPAVVLFDPGFHEGVIGIVAGRIKEAWHRPTVVLARGQDGLLKGSGRSIPGFHLRDALDLLAKRHPGLLIRFGGHAMAAGCTLAEEHLEAFQQAFEAIAAEWLPASGPERLVRTDGPLEPQWFQVATVAQLNDVVWGQGFEAPVFCEWVDVLQQQLVGAKHLKLRLRPQQAPQQVRDAIWFGRTEPLPPRVQVAYRLTVDEFQGRQRLQMVIEAAQG